MDPRIVRTRRAVLDAATDLLVEGGPAELTMDAVVARSGVAKSTLYRHWATRDDLVASVFADCAPDIESPDPDLPYPEALRGTVRALARAMGEPRWRALIPTLLLLSRQHEDLESFNTDIKQGQYAAAEEIFRRGVDEGVLDAGVLDDLQRSIWLLLGPMLLAALIERVSPEEMDDLSDAAVDQFVNAHRPT